MTLPLGGSLDGLEDRIAALDPRWLAVALALQLANVGFRALAWRNVLAAAYPTKRIRFLDVGAAYAAGVALNAYTPARAGEALKIGLVRLRVPHSSFATIAASSAVILLFDAVMGGALLLLAWALGVVPALPHPSPGLAAPVIGAAAVAVLVASRLPRLRARVREGMAILSTPRAYLVRVVPPQLGAWTCRVGVAFALLAAFDLPATIPLAGLVVVAGGLSTLVPATPGGAGTQQLLIVYALSTTASAASALTFSLGMQAGITAVNTAVGLAGLVLVLRTARPSAMRAAIREARRARA
jgi:glycosyltransferase 2 family protein